MTLAGSRTGVFKFPLQEPLFYHDSKEVCTKWLEKQTNKERLRDITDSIETGIKELFESDR